MARSNLMLSVRRRAARRRNRLIAFVLLFGAGATGIALAQSGGAYTINLNSPVSFPVDI